MSKNIKGVITWLKNWFTVTDDLAPVALSNDFNDLDNKPSGSVVDSALSSNSTNPVQNKVINTALGNKADNGHTHTLSDITDYPKTEWSEITYVSGYKGYGTSGDTVRYRRVGNVVELVGRWTPSSNKSASDDDVQFGSIPSNLAPSYPVRLRMQGSGLKTYLFTVNTTGKLYWARYGTTSSTTLTEGDWFNVQAVWTIS